MGCRMKYDPDTAAAIRGIVIVARQQLDDARHALNASDEALQWLAAELLNAQPEPKSTTPWADNPQAAQIDALVERALWLNDAEHCDLYENAAKQQQKMAWKYYRNAARRAAAEAGRLRMAVAPAPEARLYTNRVSGAAVSEVFCALLIRDVFDDATCWNQAAYDFLTWPWATVIGPAHPDDVVRS